MSRKTWFVHSLIHPSIHLLSKCFPGPCSIEDALFYWTEDRGSAIYGKWPKWQHNHHFRKKLLGIPVQRFGSCADGSEAGWVLVGSYGSKSTANTESSLGMGTLRDWVGWIRESSLNNRSKLSQVNPVTLELSFKGLTPAFHIAQADNHLWSQ